MDERFYTRFDDSDFGICFYCNNRATHFDDYLQVELCADQQCLDEAYMSASDHTEDLYDRFNRGKDEES